MFICCNYSYKIRAQVPQRVWALQRMQTPQRAWAPQRARAPQSVQAPQKSVGTTESMGTSKSAGTTKNVLTTKSASKKRKGRAAALLNIFYFSLYDIGMARKSAHRFGIHDFLQFQSFKCLRSSIFLP